MNKNDNSTLAFGQYTIELSNGPSNVYRIDNENIKQWVATCPDPEMAMSVVEGLVLVEQKRFYYPESKPKVNFESNVEKDKKPIPSFLQRKNK